MYMQTDILYEIACYKYRLTLVPTGVYKTTRGTV